MPNGEVDTAREKKEYWENVCPAVYVPHYTLSSAREDQRSSLLIYFFPLYPFLLCLFSFTCFCSLSHPALPLLSTIWGVICLSPILQGTGSHPLSTVPGAHLRLSLCLCLLLLDSGPRPATICTRHPGEDSHWAPAGALQTDEGSLQI